MMYMRFKHLILVEPWKLNVDKTFRTCFFSLLFFAICCMSRSGRGKQPRTLLKQN